MADEVRFKDLIDAIYQKNPEADLEFIQDVYWFSEAFHAGQMRRSGGAYITHPLHVAITLAELGMDIDAIAAGLLHDVVEDTSCTTRGLVDHFGQDVAFLVEGVTKLDKISYVSREERQLESYRKMFVAMAEDIRVIIIKLADRLHNMRTMSFQSPEKQKSIARETLEIFAPIADRLGIIKLKWELEDLSLRYLEPDIYYDLVNRISMKREERIEYIEEVINNISSEMDKANIHYDIEGRPKHFYSIYRKMIKKYKELDEIYDLIAIRVLVNTVQDCYQVLGIVHNLWKPVPGRIKDYIAMPKANMYQSLHTTVIGPRGERFEIQIRSFEMHHIAEYGVAAHWLYKEQGSNEARDVNQLDWIKQLKEIQDESDSSQEMLEMIKLELFSDTVFVFSPRGEVYELPIGSTPIDFAYRVHSEIGNQCVGSKVNSKIVAFDYELKTGDTVEILRSKNSKGPSQNWLNIAKSPQAKNKIRQWLKKNKREENIERGMDVYRKIIKQQSLPEHIFLKTENLNKICGKMGYHHAEDIYCALGIGGLNTTQVINRLKEEYKAELNALKLQTEDENKEIEARLTNKSEKQRQQDAQKSFDGITVRGVDDVSVRFANCCKPVPGDPIVGYITRGHGITIHHNECPNINNLSESDINRLINVQWQGYENSVYQVRLFVEALDRPKITPEVMALINDTNVHILAITSRVKNHMSLMELTVEVKSLHELNIVIDKVNSIPDVFEVRRDLSSKED